MRGKAAVTRESGEVARSGVLSGASSLLHLDLGRAGRQRENTETVAKQKQLPSAGLDTMGGACAARRSRELIIYFTAPSAGHNYYT